MSPPPSPCNKVCTLDASGYCRGCLRTGEEIARWMSLSPGEQWLLVAVLEERRSRLQDPALPGGSGHA